MTELSGLRGTGRTTRMLKEAIRLAKSGKEVVVVAANSRHCGLLLEHLESLGWNAKVKVKAKLGGDIFITADVGMFNWEKMRFYGESPNQVNLIDHFTIEQFFELKFGKLRITVSV